MALALDDHSVTPTDRASRAIRRPPRRRLGRRAHRVLLISHVLSSVGWFGLAITVAFCAVVGNSRGDVAFYDVIHSTLTLSVPLGLFSAASGIALSLTTQWGLVKHWWVVAKQASTIAVIVTDVLVIAPAMVDAVDSGTIEEVPPPLIAHCVVLAIAAVLSVWKPRARTPQFLSDRRHNSARAEL